MRTAPVLRLAPALIGAPVLALCVVLVSCGTSIKPSGAAASATTPTPPVVTYNHSCTRTATTQNAMNRCAAKEVRELQHQLSTDLSRQKKGRSPSAARLVQAAQTSFAAYEKAECTAMAAPNVGGSIYPLVFGNCEIRLTVQRIQEVQVDLSGFLGG
jgi:uncharacterized protein YecT (DUF1311 family)